MGIDGLNIRESEGICNHNLHFNDILIYFANMRHQIFRTIAADLERRVRTDPAFALPSIYELAQSYDVAYKTMWKAVRELAEKGFVRTRHGMKTRRAIGEGADAPVLSSDKPFPPPEKRNQSRWLMVAKVVKGDMCK